MYRNKMLFGNLLIGCLLIYQAAVAIQWPLSPFNTQHQVNGTFAECRGRTSPNHFHGGIDIQGSLNTHVYSVSDGIVTDIGSSSIKVGNYRYIHVRNYRVKEDSFVNAGTYICDIGQYDPVHLHLESDPQVNILFDMEPFIDNVRPRVLSLSFWRQGTDDEITENILFGQVDIQAEASDPRTASNGSSAGGNCGVYSIWAQLLQNDVQVGERIEYIRFNNLPFASINAIYTSNSHTGCNIYWVTNDPYDIPYNKYLNTKRRSGQNYDVDARINHEAMYKDGSYTVKVVAEDVFGWLDDPNYIRTAVRQIDNFCPYVQSITVSQNSAIKYLGSWPTTPASETDLGDKVIQTNESLEAAQAFSIVIAFSEDMLQTAAPSIVLCPENETNKPITGGTWLDSRRFSVNVAAGVLPETYNGCVVVKVSGARDLANNLLDSDPKSIAGRDASGAWRRYTAGTDANHKFKVGDVGFGVEATTPSTGDGDVPVTGGNKKAVGAQIKVKFNHPVDIVTFDQSSVTFSPALAGSFDIAWNADNTEVTLTLTDTENDLRYNTKYDVTLSGDIEDTAGVKLGSKQSGEPGVNYVFYFNTKSPEVKFAFTPGTQTMKRRESRQYDGHFTNKEPRALSLQLSTSPSIPGTSGWSHGLSQQQLELGAGEQASLSGLLTISLGDRPAGNSHQALVNSEIWCGNVLARNPARASASGILAQNPTTPPNNPGGQGGGSNWTQPPRRPGNDQGLVSRGGDENWSLSDPHYPAPWLFDDASQVGLLLEGFYESAGHLLGRYGISTIGVESESLKVLSSLDRGLSDLKVLIVPTGALEYQRNNGLFWQRIADYVAQGGYLMVLDQPYGDLYNRLPGSPQARGWEEDLSCTGLFTMLRDSHPVVMGQKYKQCQYPTDGYFTWLPPGAQEHAIRLLRGGAASTASYPYGQGRVFATTCYIEQAWEAGQWSASAGSMLRDAVTCGLFPEAVFAQTSFQKFKPGEAGSINVEIVRTGQPDTAATPCDRAVVDVMTPYRTVSSQQEFILSPPLLPGDTARVVIPFTAPENDSLRGIWLAGYRLFTDTAQICSTGCAIPFSVSDTLRWTPNVTRTVNPFYIAMYAESSPIIYGDSMNYVMRFGTAGQETVTVYPVVHQFLFRMPPETLYVGNPTLIGPGMEGEDCYSRMIDPRDNPYMIMSLRRASDGQDISGQVVYGTSIIFGASILGVIEVAEPDSNWKPGDRLGYKFRYQPNFSGRMLVETHLHHGGLYVNKTCTLDVAKNIASEMADSFLIDSSWTQGSYFLKIYCDRVIRDTCKLGSQRLFTASFKMPGYTVAADYIPDSLVTGADTAALRISILPSARTTGPASLRYRLYRPLGGANELTIDSTGINLDSLYDGMTIDMPYAIPESLRSLGFYNMEYALNWGLDSLNGHSAYKADVELTSFYSKTIAGWGDTVVHAARVSNKSPMFVENMPLVYGMCPSFLAALSDPNSYVWYDSTCLLSLAPGQDTLIMRYDYVGAGAYPGLRWQYAAVLSKPYGKLSYASYQVAGPFIGWGTDTSHYQPGDTVSLILYNSGPTGGEVIVENLRVEDPLGIATALPNWAGSLQPMEDTVFYRYPVPGGLAGCYVFRWNQKVVCGPDTAISEKLTEVNISGINAKVLLSTTKSLFFPADSIGPLASVENTGVLPLDHFLNLEIRKYGLEPMELFFIPDTASVWWNNWPVPDPYNAPGCTLDASGVRLLGYDRLYGQERYWSWSGAKWAKLSDGKRSLFKLFKMEQARRQAKDGSALKTELVQNLRLAGHQGRPWALIATDQRTFLIGPLPGLTDSVDVSGLGSLTGVCSDGGSFYLSSFDSGRVFKVDASSGAVQASWPAGDPGGCVFSGGRLYVTDRGGLVRVFSNQGDSLFVFGIGRLNLPQELLALDDGTLLVADFDSLKRFTADGAVLPSFFTGRFTRLAVGGDYVYGIEPDANALRKFSQTGSLCESRDMAPMDVTCAADTLYTGYINGGGTWVEGEAYLNFGKWKGRTNIFADSEIGFLNGAKYVSSFRPQASGPGSVVWRLRIANYEYGTSELSCDSLEGFDLETAQSGGRNLSFSATLESPDGNSTPSISRLDITALSLIFSDNVLWQDSIPVTLAADDSLSWQGLTPPLADSGDFYLAGQMNLGQNQLLPGIARHRFSVSGWPLWAGLSLPNDDFWPGEEVPLAVVLYNRTDSMVHDVRLVLKKNNVVVTDTVIPEMPAQSCCSLSAVFQDTVDFLIRAEASAPGLPQSTNLRTVNIEEPNCYLSLDCPDSTGPRPFLAHLGITNGWTRPVSGTVSWSWSKATVSDTMTIVPGVARNFTQQVWITDDDTLRLKLPWMRGWDIERPIAFASRAIVATDTVTTSGAGTMAFDYRVLNLGGSQLPAMLRLCLRDSLGAALDSLDKPYLLAPGDSALDQWQSAPGCGTFQLSWRLVTDTLEVVLDSSSLALEIVPAGAVVLDSLTLDKNCDSLGQAWVGLHVRNRSAEPFAGSFMVESDAGYWRSDQTLSPQSTLDLRFPITDPQETGSKRFAAHCLTSGDTLAALTRLLKFSPILMLDSLPDSLETSIGDTVEFTVSIRNLGNAVSRDTLSVNLGDLIQQTTELSLAPGQVHNEHCLGLVPEDLEDQTLLGFASLASRYHPIRAKISGYRLSVEASLDKPYYCPGDTLNLEVTAHNRNQRNSACLLTGVYREEEISDGFLLLGGMDRVDLSDPQRIVGLTPDSSWYVSGLVDAGDFDSLTVSCQKMAKRQTAEDGYSRQAQIDVRLLMEDSVTYGPWAGMLGAGRFLQFRLRPALGDTVERVTLTRYSGGISSDTTIETFDSLHIRKNLRWPFDSGQGNQSLLSYGAYTRTGRSLWLNTAYVYQGTDSFAVWPQRQVYDPGDTAVFRIHSGLSGLLKYGICLPPLPDITDSLVLSPGDTSLHLILPQEQNAGTRYLDYRLAINGDTANLISGTLRFDVNGYRVRVHDCRLSSPTWRPGDSLTAWFRLHSSHDLALNMTTRMCGPGNIFGPAETTAVAFNQGYNWLEFSRAIPENFGPGRAYLEFGLFRPGLDLGSLNFAYTVICPDTTLPSAWFVQCPGNTYESQLPYPVLAHSEDNRQTSDTLFYNAGTGWIGLLPERKENSVSEFLIPPQPRGTTVDYYLSVMDGSGNRARAPERGYAGFHVLPALPPSGLSADTTGHAVALVWGPPAGDLAYHQYSPYVAIGIPTAIRVSPPYLPARVASISAWLERPDSTLLTVMFQAPDSTGLPGQALHPGIQLTSADTSPGWMNWVLDSLGLEFTGDFYLGLDAGNRSLYGDGSAGGRRTVVFNGSAWSPDHQAGELCAHLAMRYPQAAVVYQVHRATADSSYRLLADSLPTCGYTDTSAGPEARHRYLVKSLWTQPGLYSSSLPIPITVDWLGPRFGDSLTVLFGDSSIVVGASVWDGFGVAGDSIYTPSGYSAGHDSSSGDVRWFVIPGVAAGDTAVFCILAWDSAGNPGRSPETGWHHVANTGIAGGPGGGTPTCYGLSKAYPNPARSSCSIKYQLPKTTEVSLYVYNLAGQRVKVLEEGMKQPGYYKARWDGRDEAGRRAAAGVYFYRLTAEGYQRTERLVVIR